MCVKLINSMQNCVTISVFLQLSLNGNGYNCTIVTYNILQCNIFSLNLLKSLFQARLFYHLNTEKLYNIVICVIVLFMSVSIYSDIIMHVIIYHSDKVFVPLLLFPHKIKTSI